MSNHCIDVKCPKCGCEYDAHLHWTVCPECGYDWMNESCRFVDERPKDMVAALHGKTVTPSSGVIPTFAPFSNH